MFPKAGRGEEDKEDNDENRSIQLLDLYDDIFRAISPYLTIWELKMFQRTCNRFNELELKCCPIVFHHDERYARMHNSVIYPYSAVIEMSEAARQRRVEAARQRRADIMFVLIFVYLLCS